MNGVITRGQTRKFWSTKRKRYYIIGGNFLTLCTKISRAKQQKIGVCGTSGFRIIKIQ